MKASFLKKLNTDHLEGGTYLTGRLSGPVGPNFLLRIFWKVDYGRAAQIDRDALGSSCTAWVSSKRKATINPPKILMKNS